ncbi:hypothetical protein AAKU55_005346 [Oxalobacteraceae bacterium GrIS 1.11]
MSDFYRVVEAFSSTDAGSFRWLGRKIPALSPDVAREFDAGVLRTFRVQQLKKFLYANFYIRGEPREPRAGLPQGGVAHTQFVQDILQANCGRNNWRYGGVVSEIRDGCVIIKRGALKFYARPEECSATTSPLAEAARVRLILGRDSLRIAPGFCLLFGEFDLAGGQPVLRFYWNLESNMAAGFVREATSRLNAAGLPFRLKVLADPQAYDRCDAAVLYVARSGAAAVSDVVAKIYAAIGSPRDLVPAFTRRLAPGLATADDPGNGDSFGMHRCGLVAEALILAYEQKLPDANARTALIASIFVSAGIDPAKPYLQPGLPEPDFATMQTGQSTKFDKPAVQSRPASRRTGTVRADWVGAAEAIGARIVAEAVWYRGRCQWLGAEPVPQRGMGAIDYRTLPAGLYNGTAGVALFLAELASRTGDAGARRTAAGAIRQALSKSNGQVGLYPGATGIALAAARIGALLGEDWLFERADRRARAVLRRAVVLGEHDLMYGTAGRVVGALALESLLGLAAGSAAERFGQALLRSAERSAEGSSWPGQDKRWKQNLTGLSHGAAGVAHALALLWQRTREEPYRTMAIEAICYEQKHFDAALGNWADLRTPLPGKSSADRCCSLYWCHGAPGIALQRLSFTRLTGATEYLEHARVGMETTAARLAVSLRRKVENYSLCHGLLGNAEILLEWASARGAATYRAQAEEAAAEGLRLYGGSGNWPCGTIQGDTPGLMLGRAGIGYFYLRLADPTVPSVLLIDPPSWALGEHPGNRSDTRDAPGDGDGGLL